MEIITPLENPAPIKYPVVQLDTEKTIALAHALAEHITLAELHLATLQRCNLCVQVVGQDDGGFVTVITAEQFNRPAGWTPVVPSPEPEPQPEPAPEVEPVTEPTPNEP